MPDGTRIPDLTATRGEIAAAITTATGQETVSSVELLEHDSDPGAHGGLIESSRVALARTASMVTHTEFSSPDNGATYTGTTTYYPANTRMYTARVFAKAGAASRNFYATLTMPQGWVNMQAVVAGLYDYNSVDTHVKVLASNSSSTITLELTRDAGSAAFAVGNTVIVTLLLIGTFS